MNIETYIKSDLWSAIEHSYASGNYSHAIKDAMAFVTEILRDKSGLDDDGDKLVSQALGFSSANPPRIMINKLQTQTEQDMQRGLMFLLKGMYALVRNPRSHERFEDDKKTADTVIAFIDYLLDFIGASYQSFTVQGFLDLITDPHFVPDLEYVVGLVDRIPSKKRSDTLIALYRQINWKQSTNFELVIKEILSKLDDSELDAFLQVISDDLQTIDNPGSVTLIIKILPSELWLKIQRMPRLRAENMLLDGLKEAWYIPETQKTNSAYSTWITRVAKYFIRKRNLRTVIIDKLQNRDFDQHNFVARYLIALNALQDIFEEEGDIQACANAIANSMKAGNEFLKNIVVEWIQLNSPSKWDAAFVECLRDLTDPDKPEFYLHDGTPLLGRFESKSNPVREEDIPF